MPEGFEDSTSAVLPSTPVVAPSAPIEAVPQATPQKEVGKFENTKIPTGEMSPSLKDAETFSKDVSLKGNKEKNEKEVSPIHAEVGEVKETIASAVEDGKEVTNETPQSEEQAARDGITKKKEESSQTLTQVVENTLHLSPEEKQKPFLQLLKEKGIEPKALWDIVNIPGSLGVATAKFLENHANVGEFIRFLIDTEYYNGVADALGHQNEKLFGEEGEKCLSASQVKEYTKEDPKTELTLLSSALVRAQIISQEQGETYTKSENPIDILKSEEFKRLLEATCLEKYHELFVHQIALDVLKDESIPLSKEAWIYLMNIPYDAESKHKLGESNNVAVGADSATIEEPSKSAEEPMQPIQPTQQEI